MKDATERAETTIAQFIEAELLWEAERL